MEIWFSSHSILDAQMVRIENNLSMQEWKKPNNIGHAITMFLGLPPYALKISCTWPNANIS